MDFRVDHFSIAVRSIEDTLAFFRRYFPIRIENATRDGYTDDFRWCDFFLGHVKIELIESARSGSFVERFLERRGEGIHHLSIEVLELDRRIAEMERAGLRIVDRFRASDDLQTAFISPRTAHGMLVQFWQVPEIEVPPAEKTPRVVELPEQGVRMRFDHLSVAVRDIEQAMQFFRRWFPIDAEAPQHRGYAGDFDLKQFDVGPFRMELIADANGASFVVPFLAKRGEGFHHVSIDVDRLDPLVARMKADGVRIVDEADLGGGYKTAFVSPRSAHGVLIQFWQIPNVDAPNW
jgi:methylmalonyl-CoA/ethylmalonyl-CoA epimerase